MSIEESEGVLRLKEIAYDLSKVNGIIQFINVDTGESYKHFQEDFYVPLPPVGAIISIAGGDIDRMIEKYRVEEVEYGVNFNVVRIKPIKKEFDNGQ